MMTNPREFPAGAARNSFIRGFGGKIINSQSTIMIQIYNNKSQES